MTVSVHLSKADFCVCCENIVEQGTGSLCPMCGSVAIRPLSAFLNRPELPRSIPELSHFIKIATPERIRELLGYPQEGGGL